MFAVECTDPSEYALHEADAPWRERRKFDPTHELASRIAHIAKSLNLSRKYVRTCTSHERELLFCIHRVVYSSVIG